MSYFVSVGSKVVSVSFDARDTNRQWETL